MIGNRSHERLQAREAREQERLENAYLDLLKMAEQVGQWAQMVYPIVETGPLPETPMPTLEVQAKAARIINSLQKSPAMIVLPAPGSSASRNRSGHAQLRRKCDGDSPTVIEGSRSERATCGGAAEIAREAIQMKINDPKASYSQVSGIFLNTERANDHQMLVLVKPRSLKVDRGMVTFTAIVFESDVALLYVPPSERLAHR